MTLHLDDSRIDAMAGAEADAVGGGAAPATLPVVLPPVPLSLDTPGILTKGIQKRRSAAIIGYVGLNGQGKSLAMIRDTLPSLAMGRPILSTVTILDPVTGGPHPLFIPFERWAQLEDFRDGDVLMDEVTGILDSHTQAMPDFVRRLLPQMRRRNVLIRWTGMSWDNTNLRLRQPTRAVVKCRGLFPNRRLERHNSAQQDALSMWAPNRAFVLNTFDAEALQKSSDTEQLTQDSRKERRASLLNRELFWGPGSAAFGYYNTLADVYQVAHTCDHVHPDGSVCGLKVPAKPVCKGH